MKILPKYVEELCDRYPDELREALNYLREPGHMEVTFKTPDGKEFTFRRVGVMAQSKQ